MPTTLVDPTNPQPLTALPPDARQQAYAQLLAQAESGRSDKGASSQMMADILNKVDMGGADRVTGMWAGRQANDTLAGSNMLQGVSDAYAAQRALNASRGSGRGGSGRGGGGGGTQQQADPFAQTDWMNDYMNQILGYGRYTVNAPVFNGTPSASTHYGSADAMGRQAQAAAAARAAALRSGGRGGPTGKVR